MRNKNRHKLLEWTRNNKFNPDLLVMWKMKYADGQT
jgi:hypothetical protein